MRRTIYITRDDMQRLRNLVDGLLASARAEVATLEEELDRAQVVDDSKIRPDVITLNSRMRILDLDSGRMSEYEIVFPHTKPLSSAEGLSVLAPLGTALLGHRAGDSVEWEAPKGKRRVKVLEVLYQPEAARSSAA